MGMDPHLTMVWCINS